jgi:hypothetical protein
VLFGTIILGLATRVTPSAFPAVVARYGGDALWALMVFWLLALLRPAATTHRLAVGALGIACAVELTQLYRAPWIDAVRATSAGGLVLGHGFLWSDIVSYAVGIVMAAGGDHLLWNRALGAGRPTRTNS